MDDKLKIAIEKIVRLAKQNKDFQFALQKEFNILSLSAGATHGDSKIDEIYEYCIKKILERQAHEFYLDFPIKEIIRGLEEDFIRMETFRRQDMFDDFCFAMYQQIERITNYLCESGDLNDITKKMWAYSAYLKEGKDITPTLQERAAGDYCIASLVFPGENKEKKIPYAVEKSKQSLQALYAKDKMRTVVYFIGYRAMMLRGDYKHFIEMNELLSDLYNCRNRNHRGNTPNIYEEEAMKKIMPIKSLYYFKFMGVLAQYVDYVKHGMPSEELKNYAINLPDKNVVVVPNLKIIKKIDLPDDGKKRFR